ncbi:MAG TPA: hypothetical protein VJT80_03475 [Steroidobacteraceae bacterium]|nr:hypothetical protein [Steroidobacteraceae bacterium]
MSRRFPTIELGNDLIGCTVLPELGAKILSLRDLRNGREWLWTSDRLPLARQPYGVSYIEKADTGGWDECFPTVAACQYPLEPGRGRAVPDHGDLWCQAWSSDVRRHAECIQLVTSCRAVSLPCKFTRTLSLSDDNSRVHLHYSVRNEGTQAVAFIWSAHPLLSIEPGMRLEFPMSATFNVYSATPATTLPGNAGLRWPISVRRNAHSIALDPLPGPDAGIAFKIWSDPLREGWTRLVARNGALRMRFDVGEIPQIALWLNAGGWTGTGGEPYYNLALEPCIGAQDSLAEAVSLYDRYAMLYPEQVREWALTVELEAA